VIELYSFREGFSSLVWPILLFYFARVFLDNFDIHFCGAKNGTPEFSQIT
jgi:hypothetical protein